MFSDANGDLCHRLTTNARDLRLRSPTFYSCDKDILSDRTSHTEVGNVVQEILSGPLFFILNAFSQGGTGRNR